MSVSGASRDPSNVGEKPRSNPGLFTFLLLLFIGAYYKPVAGVLFRKIRRIVFALSASEAGRQSEIPPILPWDRRAGIHKRH